MNISSRTPEGDPNTCPVCGNQLRLEPSRPPGDAPCPSCGILLWFPSTTAIPLPIAARVEGDWRLVAAGSRDVISLTRPVLTIGRRESCDICVRQANVSGLHCLLTFHEGQWSVTDHGSTNGVKVNGVRVPKKVLRSGDVVTIGRRHYTIDRTLPVGNAAYGSTEKPA